LTGLSFTAGDGTDDNHMQFSGTLANINAALNGMTFSPTSNYNAGGTYVQIGVTDLGNTGSGGALDRQRHGQHHHRRRQRRAGSLRLEQLHVA
jgi:hypothetical protein